MSVDEGLDGDGSAEVGEGGHFGEGECRGRSRVVAVAEAAVAEGGKRHLHCQSITAGGRLGHLTRLK